MAVLENPFLGPLRQILESAGPWSEHQILSMLVAQGLLSADYGRDSLALFQAHFLVMNALYTIQKLEKVAGKQLQISALKIQWLPAGQSSAGHGEIKLHDHSLSDYYLNFDNFNRASQDSVEELLNSFWTRYIAQDNKCAALAVLDLEGCNEFAVIKKRYRQLAMQHHPDRGGDARQLANINDAYETLKRCFHSSEKQSNL